ncbi:MAG: tRNA lysidine(34) synthetase TilS, partial [Spirochaetota bacterium]
MLLTEKTKCLEDTFVQFLEDYSIKRNVSILIGFSGGPDSTALLALFSKVSARWNIHLECAYVDHGIRTEAELHEDYRIVRQNADFFRTKLTILKVPPGKIQAVSRRERRSVEEVARLFRFKMLSKLLLERKFEYLALGHTMDDHLETMIMHFFQGSGAAGLKGIPQIHGRIIRPLLRCRKTDLVDYLKGQQIPWAADLSNLQDVFLRNRVRKRLIPAVEEIFPGYRNSLAVLAYKMKLTEHFIAHYAARVLCWEKVPEGYRIKLKT